MEGLLHSLGSKLGTACSNLVGSSQLPKPLQPLQLLQPPQVPGEELLGAHMYSGWLLEATAQQWKGQRKFEQLLQGQGQQGEGQQGQGQQGQGRLGQGQGRLGQGHGDGQPWQGQQGQAGNSSYFSHHAQLPKANGGGVKLEDGPLANGDAVTTSPMQQQPFQGQVTNKAEIMHPMTQLLLAKTPSAYVLDPGAQVGWAHACMHALLVFLGGGSWCACQVMSQTQYAHLHACSLEIKCCN